MCWNQNRNSVSALLPSVQIEYQQKVSKKNQYKIPVISRRCSTFSGLFIAKYRVTWPARSDTITCSSSWNSSINQTSISSNSLPCRREWLWEIGKFGRREWQFDQQLWTRWWTCSTGRLRQIPFPTTERSTMPGIILLKNYFCSIHGTCGISIPILSSENFQFHFRVVKKFNSEWVH